METKFDSKLLLIVMMSVAFLVGAMAAPKTGGGKGFDDYGYNDEGDIFIGCYTNYVNWKLDRPMVECPENDMEVHAKWHFNKEGGLDWLINLLYTPLTGDHVLNKYVTIEQSECDAVGGIWRGTLTVTQTGESVPVCQIMQVGSGEGATLIATPVGFGLYKEG